jgi:hypothetical protein
LTAQQEPAEWAYGASGTDKLVTYWSDGIVKVISPQEFKPLEKHQGALRALVRYYASLGGDHA